MRNILVLRGGALGDLIVTLPALAALRRAWPSARIELVGNPIAAALARAAGLIDAAHSQHEARWSALCGTAPLPGEFEAWLATFDLVVNFWPDDDGELARHFPRRAGQKYLATSAQPVGAPAAAHFQSPLRALGLDVVGNFFPLREPSPAARFIAIHPGSGSPKKNWPLERWSALGEWLRDARRAELLIITGEAESDAARALGRFGAPAHALPLDALVARLGECRLFLGHDSGVSHLAAACGVPCVLLFGPTNPAIWAPPAPHVHVIRRGMEMSAIFVEEMQLEVVSRVIARSPAS